MIIREQLWICIVLLIISQQLHINCNHLSASQYDHEPIVIIEDQDDKKLKSPNSLYKKSTLKSKSLSSGGHGIRNHSNIIGSPTKHADNAEMQRTFWIPERDLDYFSSRNSSATRKLLNISNFSSSFMTEGNDTQNSLNDYNDDIPLKTSKRSKKEKQVTTKSMTHLKQQSKKEKQSARTIDNALEDVTEVRATDNHEQGTFKTDKQTNHAVHNERKADVTLIGTPNETTETINLDVNRQPITETTEDNIHQTEASSTTDTTTTTTTQNTHKTEIPSLDNPTQQSSSSTKNVYDYDEQKSMPLTLNNPLQLESLSKNINGYPQEALELPNIIDSTEQKSSISPDVPNGRDDQGKESSSINGRDDQGKESSSINGRDDQGKESSSINGRDDQGKESSNINGRDDQGKESSSINGREDQGKESSNINDSDKKTSLTSNIDENIEQRAAIPNTNTPIQESTTSAKVNASKNSIQQQNSSNGTNSNEQITETQKIIDSTEQGSGSQSLNDSIIEQNTTTSNFNTSSSQQRMAYDINDLGKEISDTPNLNDSVQEMYLEANNEHREPKPIKTNVNDSIIQRSVSTTTNRPSQQMLLATTDNVSNGNKTETITDNKPTEQRSLSPTMSALSQLRSIPTTVDKTIQETTESVTNNNTSQLGSVSQTLSENRSVVSNVNDTVVIPNNSSQQISSSPNANVSTQQNPVAATVSDGDDEKPETLSDNNDLINNDLIEQNSTTSTAGNELDKSEKINSNEISQQRSTTLSSTKHTSPTSYVNRHSKTSSNVPSLSTNMSGAFNFTNNTLYNSSRNEKMLNEFFNRSNTSSTSPFFNPIPTKLTDVSVTATTTKGNTIDTDSSSIHSKSLFSNPGFEADQPIISQPENIYPTSENTRANKILVNQPVKSIAAFSLPLQNPGFRSHMPLYTPIQHPIIQSNIMTSSYPPTMKYMDLKNIGILNYAQPRLNRLKSIDQMYYKNIMSARHDVTLNNPPTLRAAMKSDNIFTQPYLTKSKTTYKKTKPNILTTHKRPFVVTPTVIKRLTQSLKRNILDVWPYPRYIKTPADAMLDQGLINRAKLQISSGTRLNNLFKRAVHGENIKVAYISSSLFRKQSINSMKGHLLLYNQALLYWFHKVITPITGSKLLQVKVEIPDVKEDYFSRCLENHLPHPEDINLFIWELAELKHKPGGKLGPANGEYTETLIKNALNYSSHPELIMVDFYRGSKRNKGDYCRQLNQDMEVKLASLYDCTFLSWSKSICPYLRDDEEGFSYSYLFSGDKAHPSIIGHAQMAYILADYLRDEFLKYLTEHSTKNLKYKDFVSKTRDFPKPTYSNVHKALCYTSLKSLGNTLDASNTPLSVLFIKPKDVENADQRSSITLGMGDTKVHSVILRFSIPGRPQEIRHTTLGILPYFSKPALTVARVDDQPFIKLNTNKITKGQIVELQPTTRLTNGNHMVRFYSLDKRFKVLAFTVDEKQNITEY